MTTTRVAVPRHSPAGLEEGMPILTVVLAILTGIAFRTFGVLGGAAGMLGWAVLMCLVLVGGETR